MKVFYSPQINDEHQVSYEFNGDIITATVNGETDTFDFTSMPDDSIAQSIKSTLPVVVVCGAKKDENGELWVTLFNPINEKSSHADRWPDWIDV